MLSVGIDSGAKGGFAIYSQSGVECTVLCAVLPMVDIKVNGKLRQELDTVRLAGWIGVLPMGAAIVLEKLGASRPQRRQNKDGSEVVTGVSSQWAQAKMYGEIEALVKTSGKKYILVSPQKWKNKLGVTSDKQTSIAACQRLFPGVSLLATPRSRKPHDGMAEACLLAYYGTIATVRGRD